MIGDNLRTYGRSHHNMDFLRFDVSQEGARDFTDQLQAIKDCQPDLFINGSVIATTHLVIKQAAEVGLLPGTPMMVSSVYPQRSSDFWRLSGTTGVGTIWPATRYRPSWNGITKIGRWFVDGYVKRYGSFPPDTALTHFTDVTIIAAAVNAARSDSREDVLDALEAMQFDTWRGPVSSKGDPRAGTTPPRSSSCCSTSTSSRTSTTRRSSIPGIWLPPSTNRRRRDSDSALGDVPL